MSLLLLYIYYYYLFQVDALKLKIADERGDEFPVEGQKLIYSGIYIYIYLLSFFCFSETKLLWQLKQIPVALFLGVKDIYFDYFIHVL